jgi:hypothetical protein
MTKPQNNKFSMYNSVRIECLNNTQVWENVPAFKAAFEEFDSSLSKLRSLVEQQIKDLTGVTKDKSLLHQDMVQKAVVIAGAVHAFAARTDNLELKQQMDFSVSDLKKTSDNISSQNCQMIATTAKSIGKELSEYGVKPEDVDSLQKAIDAFNAQNTAPREAITRRKGTGEEIEKMFQQIDALLVDVMDKLAGQFRVTAPEFYRLYASNRMIVDAGTRYAPTSTSDVASPTTNVASPTATT